MSSLAPDTGTDAARKLQDAFGRWDSESIRLQKRRVPIVIFAITLGPLAVLLLATQALAFPNGGSIAVTLIALELAALTVALWIAFLRIGRVHDRWITARLRAETLRREQFLLFAQVGPYLNLGPEAVATHIEQRLLVLDNALHDAVALLPLSDTNGSWRDAVEDGKSHPAFANVLGDARTYLVQRVTDQLKWFAGKSHLHERRSVLFENAARITLTLALIVAAVHLGLLLRHGTDPASVFEHILLIAAIALPAIGSAVIALESASGSQRLARSYHHYASVLEPLEDSLLTLADRATVGTPHDVLKFKRLVLSVEQILSDEIHQWWMIMAVSEPRPTA